jgi:hypothetical protein
MGDMSKYMRDLHKRDPHLHAILSRKGRLAAAKKREEDKKKRQEEQRRFDELRAFAERHPPSKPSGPLTEKQVRKERMKMDKQANMHICPID